jgi:uncharacterized protein YjiS (DUF1127 family)
MSTIYNDCAAEPRLNNGSHVAATILRVASKAGNIVLWPLRVLQARRELEMLAQMSEFELKDIGLTRSDIGDATALRADESPTDFLAARVGERFGARRA